MSFYLALIFVLLLWKVVVPLGTILFTYTLGKWLFSGRKRLRNAGKWAIVTGSTDGIGKAYANQLAKDGLNIMLISRSGDKLRQVASEIESRYGVKTKIHITDFCQVDIYEKLELEINELGSIACLVNNVGMSYPNMDEFWKADFLNLKFIKDMLACNMNSVACLTRIVLPLLIDQGKSGAAIINVASAAGLNSLPYLSLYSASKAFVLSLSKALSCELFENRHIQIQTVCPYLVATNMSKIKRVSFMVPSPDQVASISLDLIGVQSVTCGCFGHALQDFSMNLTPSFLIGKHLKAVMESSKRRKRE